MTEKLDGLVIHNTLVENRSFDRWYHSGERFTIGFPDFVVEVVKAVSDSAENSYGEAYQGWSGVAEIVFRVDQDGFAPRFFRKVGTVDSYIDTSWGGKFEEVTLQEKVVTVYEYK